MKKRKLITLILFILISLGMFLNVSTIETYAATTSTKSTSNYKNKTGYVVVQKVALRTKAQDGAKKVTILTYNQKITITGEKNDYYKIKTTSGKVGYVKTKYISTQQPQKGYIVVNKAALRTKAQDTAKKVTILTYNQKVTIAYKNNGWYTIITSSGKIGYVKEEYVSTQQPQTGYSIAKKVAVRVNAQDGAKKVTTLTTNQKVTITYEENEWYKIRTSSGKTGYVKKMYISTIKSSKRKTAYVIVQQAALRTKAQDGAKKVAVLPYAQELTITGEANGWYTVKTTSGKIGYIKTKYVSTEKPYVERKGYVSTVYAINLNALPQDNSNKVTTLTPSQIVTITGEQNGWYKLKTSSGQEGYVRTSYISTKNPDEAELLTTYTTYSKGSPANRNFNIARACGKISGTTLKPGESFNWFVVVGSCGKANGYKTATVIVNGRYIQDYGGGVCQVATTLCGAAKSLNIKDIYCRPHSGAVSYLNGDGVEAAVSYGSKNFIFKNTTGNTIRIEMYSSGGRVIAAIYKIK